MKLVCITGLPGSGKTVASDFFVNNNFQYLRFGQITLDELKRKRLEINETNERKVREGFRKKYGMGAYAILNLPAFRKLLKNGDVIGDGLYSFEEYKILKKEFGNKFITIAIYAPPDIRYKRLASRKLLSKDKNIINRPLTKNEAETRDYSEIEKLNKGGTIAMANYTIVNTNSIQYFKTQLKKICNEIKKNK
jgi:dephospho-CoA kinase